MIIITIIFCDAFELLVAMDLGLREQEAHATLRLQYRERNTNMEF
jgi:hypothetical protein